MKKSNSRLLVLILALTVMVLGAVVLAQPPGGVLVLTAKGPVTPVMLSYIQRGIAVAETRQANALVIQLDTPGGQLDLTREIIQSIINANVPVVVYVYPPGGYAASAGTFITLAGHVAAMAPQTSIGAASPVGSQGEDVGETMQAKLNNILTADMTNLAQRRGEKVVRWATQAVTEARAAAATEALDLGLIDVIATDVPDLLQQIDGMTVKVRGADYILHTTGVPVVDFGMTLAEQILAVILRPEIAFLLLAIGPLAIIYELTSPGGYVGGVVGLICLVVGMYAVGQLPVNFAGIALLVLAFIFFGSEAFVPTHGALSMAGVVSLLLAGLLLFDEGRLGYQVSTTPMVATAVSVGAIFFFMVTKMVATLKIKSVSGSERMIGMTGIVKTPLAPTGIILADGTRWQATLVDGEPHAQAGESVQIVAITGLRVKVKRVSLRT